LIEELLKKSSLKNTKQRSYILSIIEISKTPVTAEEIYTLLQNDNKDINLSTVYRTLNVFVERNVLFKILKSDGIASYQLNDAIHNHYITCYMCNNSKLIDECPMKDLGKQINIDTGYIVTGHSFQLVGICPKCLEQEKNKQDK